MISVYMKSLIIHGSEKLNALHTTEHLRYFISLFDGYKIEYRVDDSIIYGSNTFRVTIDSKYRIIDYSDNPLLSVNDSISYHSVGGNNIPFVPISFNDWSLYKYHRITTVYRGNSNIISMRQRLYGDARNRRYRARQLLSPYNPLTNTIDQHSYLSEISNILLAVFIPGAYTNMLDRGHLQYLMLGCPTISPIIPESLCGHQLIPYEHYIPINNINDLPLTIEWCLSHKKLLLDIGHNAMAYLDTIAVNHILVDYIHAMI